MSLLPIGGTCAKCSAGIGAGNSAGFAKRAHTQGESMLQRQTQHRFPRHIEPRPPLSLTIGHALEQLQQQQRRHHRRRMRPPAPARRIQRIKIRVAEQLPPSLPQRRQEPRRVEQIAHHHPDIKNRTLTISRTAAPHHHPRSQPPTRGPTPRLSDHPASTCARW